MVKFNPHLWIFTRGIKLYFDKLKVVHVLSGLVAIAVKVSYPLIIAAICSSFQPA